MTLPTSGAIDLAHIGQEAQETANLFGQAAINAAKIRKLPNIAGKTVNNSPISFSDFYGTAYGVGMGYGATNFTSNLNAAVSTNTYSNLIYVYGVGSSTVSALIDCPGTVAYVRVNGGTWTAENTIISIKDGDTLELYVTTPATLNTDCSVTLSTAGNVYSKDWTCWTLQGTGLADFTAKTNANLKTSYTSSNLKVSGVGATPVSMSVTGATAYTVNGSTGTAVKDNDVVALTATSSASLSTTTSPQVTYGTTTKIWTITTAAAGPTISGYFQFGTDNNGLRHVANIIYGSTPTGTYLGDLGNIGLVAIANGSWGSSNYALPTGTATSYSYVSFTVGGIATDSVSIAPIANSVTYSGSAWPQVPNQMRTPHAYVANTYYVNQQFTTLYLNGVQWGYSVGVWHAGASFALIPPSTWQNL